MSVVELGVLVATLISSELALRLPITPMARALAVALQKSRKALFSKNISDHWKEKVLPIYALRIFKNSIVLPLLLAVLFAPIVTATLLFSTSLAAALGTLTSVSMLSLITATSIVYLVIRVKFFDAKLFKT